MYLNEVIFNPLFLFGTIQEKSASKKT